MTKSSSFITLGAISLDKTSLTPLHRQLYESMREAILTRQLAPGLRLPPTRVLATELGVSRNTVMNAFEQLIAEGYIQGKVGAGTYVTRALPEESLQVRPGGSRQGLTGQAVFLHAGQGALSKRGSLIAATPVSFAWSSPTPRPFRPGLPALDAFPFKLWERLMLRRWRNLSPASLSYGQASGYQPLREAIATYLGAARGVRCEAAQVIVVAGAQQGIALAARLLLDREDPVWIEEPGYQGARGALLAAGAQLYPIPVDQEGLAVEIGVSYCPAARLVYITPSHQYPVGVTMSLARRLALLKWAGATGAWILEDDYDSEYRYAGRPLAALQGLDQTGCVIYIGTFSKVMFPGLRLGYLVVPQNLVDAFTAVAAVESRCPSFLDQAVLTDFINEGHLARHIRRMRTLYAERQATLIEAVQERLAGLLEINPAETGLHLLGWLASGLEGDLVSQQLLHQRVEAPSLSGYSINPPQREGLVLGYAAVSPGDIRAGVRQMESVLTKLAQSIARQ
jgi:GntR family transcriptional regulator/MocR family aminotransferase